MNFSYSIRQPTVFGKYLLLDRVNIGGMAEVWRAKAFGAGGFERIVAIKRVLPNIARDPEFITMFIDEAKLTVNLTHANIAKIDELNHVGDSYYIAMEYVSGRDMRAVFEKFREQQEIAPVALTCFVLAACCEALDYAHRAKDSVGNELKVIHRDVSPQNILLSYEGEVKLIDFGIAKAAGKVNKTQAGILKGKFSYMSPEQVRGLPLDQRSDIFALGICLYEMLTGERLFTASTDFATLEAVRHAEIPLPSSRNSKVSPKLDEIVLKALSRNLDERYEWASELGQDLLTFMYSTGTPYTRKDLQAYMRSTFAEDYDRERSRLKEYAGIKAPPALGGTASLEGITTQAPASTSGIEPPTLGATVVTAVGQVGVPTLSPPFGDPARSPMEPPLEPTKRMNVPQEVAAAALTETPPHIEPPRPAPPSPRSSLRTPVPQARATAPAPKLKQRPPAPKLSPPVANLEKNSPTRRLVVPILVGATVVLLAGAVGFAVKLDKPPQGYVIIDIPQELRGKATLRIGASAPALQAENSWPVVRKVETGPVKVELSAPGYTSASHILYVREGESAALYEELKAAEASTSTR